MSKKFILKKFSYDQLLRELLAGKTLKQICEIYQLEEFFVSRAIMDLIIQHKNDFFEA